MKTSFEQQTERPSRLPGLGSGPFRFGMGFPELLDLLDQSSIEYDYGMQNGEMYVECPELQAYFAFTRQEEGMSLERMRIGGERVDRRSLAVDMGLVELQKQIRIRTISSRLRNRACRVSVGSA